MRLESAAKMGQETMPAECSGLGGRDASPESARKEQIGEYEVHASVRCHCGRIDSQVERHSTLAIHRNVKVIWASERQLPRVWDWLAVKRYLDQRAQGNGMRLVGGRGGP